MNRFDRIVYEVRDGEIYPVPYRDLLRAAAREVCGPRGVTTEYSIAPRTVYEVHAGDRITRHLHPADALAAASDADGDADITTAVVWEMVRLLPGGRRRRAATLAETYESEESAEEALLCQWEVDLFRHPDIEWYETREDAEAALRESE